MQEQRSNVIRGMEILRKKLKETLKLKNTVAEMKNTFDRSFPLDITKEQTPEVKVMSMETPKIEMQR